MTDAPKPSQVGPTKGPWTNHEHSTFVSSKHGNVCACGDPHASRFVGYTECDIGSPSLSEAVANARLIAEAGTVYSESGLSPRALLEQRDAAQAELRETLRHVLHHCGPSLTHTIVTAVLSARSAEPPQDLHKVEREDDGCAPIYREGDRVLVEAIVADVATVPSNWPIRIVRDHGDSETIDLSGNVHYSAIHPLSKDDGWLPIESAPSGDDDFYLVWGPDAGSAFVVRGSILWSARKAGTPRHLTLNHITHWRPLPPPPAAARGE